MLEAVVDALDDIRRPRRASALESEGDASIDLPLRPRMLRILAQNLAENAIRYAGHGATSRSRSAVQATSWC